jgi:hypothetical protein
VERLVTPLAGLAAAAFSALSMTAHAAPRLDYRAAAGCPADAEFVAAVRARGGNVDVAGDPTEELEVVIERTNDGYRGSVRVRSTDQSSEARDVRSPACDEVADGLAIVTALASQTGSLPETATVPATTSARAPAAIEAKAPPASVATKPAASTRLHTAGQFHDETLTVSSGELRIRNDTAVSLTGGALFGMTPQVIPRVDLTFARTNFITTPDGAGHIIGGILRTRWTVLTPTEYRKGDWSARFYAMKASIGACSKLAYDLAGFVLLFCGEIGAGVSKVTTKDPAGRTTKDELVGLGSAAFEFDARYNFGRYFHAGLMVGAEGWLAQIKAVDSDGSEIFHANAFDGYAMAGVGMHFW